MAEATYTTRATTKAHVLAKVAKLNLPTINKQYTHDDTTQFVLGIKRVLKGTYNPLSRQEMVDLLRSSTNPINPTAIAGIKARDSATITSVLDVSVAAAEKIWLASDDPNMAVVPSILTRDDAMDAANQRNVLN